MNWGCVTGLPVNINGAYQLSTHAFDRQIDQKMTKLMINDAFTQVFITASILFQCDTQL